MIDRMMMKRRFVLGAGAGAVGGLESIMVRGLFAHGPYDCKGNWRVDRSLTFALADTQPVAHHRGVELYEWLQAARRSRACRRNGRRDGTPFQIRLTRLRAAVVAELPLAAAGLFAELGLAQ